MGYTKRLTSSKRNQNLVYFSMIQNQMNTKWWVFLLGFAYYLNLFPRNVMWITCFDRNILSDSFSSAQNLKDASGKNYRSTKKNSTRNTRNFNTNKYLFICHGDTHTHLTPIYTQRKDRRAAFGSLINKQILYRSFLSTVCKLAFYLFTIFVPWPKM